MHETVAMQYAKRLGNAREIAPQHYSAEWHPQRPNPISGWSPTQLGMQRYSAGFMKHAERVGSLHHADHADHDVVGAGIAHHSFDLEPLMAPELTELRVDAGAGLQPEFEDPVLPGRSIGGLDQSRPERRRHWPLEIVLRKFERLVEAQHPRFSGHAPL
jgi:hypothetical protein